MLRDDGANRGRLLTESSTRAFAALRDRANSSLAKIRLVAGGAFCLMSAVLALLGTADARSHLWPMLAYVLASFAVFRWLGQGGWRDKVAEFSPLADVMFVFALQAQAFSHRDVADFGAGFSLGLYALLVGFSAVSLRKPVVVTTAGVCLVLLAVLQAWAGIVWSGVVASGLVLLLLAAAAVAVVGEIDRVMARLVLNEVSHDELRKAHDEAETLTHLLVHDMKGPLTGLIGLAEVVASELTGRLHSDVKMIEQQGRRLQTMVGDLLAIARLERGVLQSPPETVDLSALLASLANSYAAKARQAGARMSAAVQPGLCAQLHRDMVHRLFDNLVLNALDFVRPGGRIEVAAWEDEAGLSLAVRNTGEPVPADVRQKLFQRGGSSRSHGHNLGLGLYLCSLVALAHDGAIALVEEPGWAASFVATLPVETSTAAPSPQALITRAGIAG